MDLRISEKYVPTIFTYLDFATPFEAKMNKMGKNLPKQWQAPILLNYCGLWTCQVYYRNIRTKVKVKLYITDHNSAHTYSYTRTLSFERKKTFKTCSWSQDQNSFHSFGYVGDTIMVLGIGQPFPRGNSLTRVRFYNSALISKG